MLAWFRLPHEIWGYHSLIHHNRIYSVGGGSTVIHVRNSLENCMDTHPRQQLTIWGIHGFHHYLILIAVTLLWCRLWQPISKSPHSAVSHKSQTQCFIPKQNALVSIIYEAGGLGNNMEMFYIISSIVLTRPRGTRSRPTTSQKIL
jgi:hypothetical protein